MQINIGVTLQRITDCGVDTSYIKQRIETNYCIKFYEFSLIALAL